MAHAAGRSLLLGRRRHQEGDERTMQTVAEQAAVGNIIVIVLAGLIAAAVWRVSRRLTDSDNDQAARTVLARRGYRYLSRELWMVTHEDDEGWWSGVCVGRYPNVVAAAAAAIRHDQNRKEQR